METVDLEKDYRKSGEGANGDSYDCLYDSSTMLKMYNAAYPANMIAEELEVAQKVFSLGIPSPQPGELVTDGERLGIRFKRIIGKRSIARMIADEPQRMEPYTRLFAKYCRQLHSTPCPDGLFPDAIEQARHFLDCDKVFTLDEKAVISTFIDSVPHCGTAVHGDMHIGNMISTLPAGAPLSCNHSEYFIDLGLFSQGCPLLDIGMMQIVCFMSDEAFRRETYHLTGEQTHAIWDIFVDEYFGPDASPQAIYDTILPYSCLKMFLIEFNAKALFPHYEKLIRQTFGL